MTEDERWWLEEHTLTTSKLINFVVDKIKRDTKGLGCLRFGHIEQYTDTCYALEGVLFLADVLKDEVRAMERDKMAYVQTDETDGTSYYIENDNSWFYTLPDEIIVLEVGWLSAYKYEGKPVVDYRYVPERTCRDVSDVRGIFICSECEALVKHMNVGRSYVDEGGKRWYATSNEHAVNYCPNCGARIEVDR